MKIGLWTLGFGLLALSLSSCGRRQELSVPQGATIYVAEPVQIRALVESPKGPVKSKGVVTLRKGDTIKIERAADAETVPAPEPEPAPEMKTTHL